MKEAITRLGRPTCHEIGCSCRSRWFWF